MNNKVSYVGKNFDINSLVSENYYFAQLDGNDVSNKSELLLALKNIFKIPGADNWDAVSDWLSDLDWLGKEGYILYIRNYKLLLATDVEAKEIFLDILSDTVDWWSGDVEQYVVDGKKKSFNV